VEADNPNLTWRPTGRRAGRKRLLRIILDSRLDTPLDSIVFDTSENAPTLVAASAPDRHKRAVLEKKGVEVVRIPPDSSGRPEISALLKYLGGRGIQSVLVEGGAGVLGSFYDMNLVDEAFFFFAPLVIGGVDAKEAIGGRGADIIPKASRIRGISIKRFGDNWLVRGVASDLDGLWKR